jgi:hypothetical protein
MVDPAGACRAPCLAQSSIVCARPYIVGRGTLTRCHALRARNREADPEP